MKILVFIITIFFTSNLLATDMYYDYCIEDAYFKDGYFYVTRSDGSTYDYSSFYAYRYDTDYIYNPDDGTCRKATFLGMSRSQYNFLYALVGLVFGLSFFWIVPSGGKK